jgi:hypothetical protein
MMCVVMVGVVGVDTGHDGRDGWIWTVTNTLFWPTLFINGTC